MKRPVAPTRGTPVLVRLPGFPPLVRYSSGVLASDGFSLYCYSGPRDEGDDGFPFSNWSRLRASVEDAENDDSPAVTPEVLS